MNADVFSLNDGLRTLKAVSRGYLPRVLQARGWVLLALAMGPVMLVAIATLFAKLIKPVGVEAADGMTALKIFHEGLIKVMLPIMALVAAPAGIREDLEQRTLPLMLARPSAAWILPFAKGLLWFGWGALCLLAATLALVALGGPLAYLPSQAAAIVAAYWAELGFLALLGLVFKRGTLWGALYLFVWDPLVRVLPGKLQLFTFHHHIESIAGSRSIEVGARNLLAQEQIASPVWLSLLILFLVGLTAWALCGLKLQFTPVGLAGQEAEG